MLPASLAVLLTLSLAGCMIHVDKDEKGQEKKVEVDSPFGHVHVNTDEANPADLGLPAYPGAQQVKDNDGDKSADINVGFGQWEIKVKAISYLTPDSRDKVIAFYKKALGAYGTVITCQDSTAVGKPSVTSEGLTCDDDSSMSNVQVKSNKDGKGVTINSDKGGKGFQLKAGSKHHQHILGIEESTDGKTHFALVAIDLPSDLDKKKDKD
jgi:hypothetical protein